jgi:DNA-binding XRE family transcriptional regulator
MILRRASIDSPGRGDFPKVTEMAYWRRAGLAAARKAAGHTQESLAAKLHVAPSTIVRWEAGDYAPLPYVRPKLARLLGCSQQQLDDLIREPNQDIGQLAHDVDFACDWLDRQAGWASGSCRRMVISRLASLNMAELRDQDIRRGRVSRSDVVSALAGYYGPRADGHGTYRARFDDCEVATSIMSRADWLDLVCPLTPGNDRLELASAVVNDQISFDDIAARHAMSRLVEIAAREVRIADLPLYGLTSLNVSEGGIVGSLNLTSFLKYALTTDLVEGELIDAVAGGSMIEPGLLPLRDTYLPRVTSILDVESRSCAGGALALFAIARPEDRYRGPADYLLLIQERAGHVLNTTGRLAVVPKGFHQPLSDSRAGAPISATLRRELEEELFGRSDVDNTLGERRVADPMHPNRLSEPMQWLSADQTRLRLECTGFGFNLVNGNYEFASLMVIDDEEFWNRYGDRIEANWESVGLRQYSSLDRRFITELIADESWSNEGLFALLQGLRRLGQVGGNRTNLPKVEWDLV